METVLSQHQKFRVAQTVAMELPPLASEVGMSEFDERLSLLKQLRNIWSVGGKAIVQQVDLGQESQEEGNTTHSFCEAALFPVQHTIAIRCVFSIHIGARKAMGNNEDSGEEHTVQVQLQNKQNDNPKKELSKFQIFQRQYMHVFIVLSNWLQGLGEIQVPPKVRKRGRPKGAEKTAIGLPRKKKKDDKPVPFSKDNPLRKREVSLNEQQHCIGVYVIVRACLPGIYAKYTK